ncbi:hypothetical protein GWI33_016183 [Rhynchophorus ferrugineus]|uniref:Uncharacterized protein n=1 Tax=Rhynchophorus ferrugineus TaxID=354439 RepID=A0A834M3K1_RHYFE|nr:hypothetical protein GWI33_016183 [Rhynchophorus ferrugineus]
MHQNVSKTGKPPTVLVDPTPCGAVNFDDSPRSVRSVSRNFLRDVGVLIRTFPVPQNVSRQDNSSPGFFLGSAPLNGSRRTPADERKKIENRRKKQNSIDYSSNTVGPAAANYEIDFHKSRWAGSRHLSPRGVGDPRHRRGCRAADRPAGVGDEGGRRCDGGPRESESGLFLGERDVEGEST